jgi:hypothetical protein
MVAPYTATPKIGADFNTVTTAANLALGVSADARLGDQQWGSDGRLYVYAQADGTISASDADCAINATTFIASASGGSYRSPPVAMAVGDRGWFSKASV